jgi:60 kDa SS-A/Ro ribonucleoprotein
VQNINNVFGAARLRTQPSVDVNDVVLNWEGAPAYRRSLEEQTLQVLMTGTLGDTFYVSGQDLAEEAIQVLVQMRESDPDFLARALVYAREEGLLKSVPTLGLAILSGGQGRTRHAFEKAFDRVIRIPDDLRAFVTLCKSGAIPGVKGLGGMRVKAVRRWLQGLSEYHAVKYGSAASRGITLRDVLRLSHPRPSSPALAERFGWLVKGSKGLGFAQDLNPQIRAFEALKRAATEEEKVTLIREGRLPFEAVVPACQGTSTSIWRELLRQAPFFNLLRMLVAFNRHDVFTSEESVDLVVRKLTDEQAIRRSGVLPFRFFDAWRAWTSQRQVTLDSRISDALREALNLSMFNMPSFGERKVCIAPDVSISMNGLISHKGSTSFIDIAAIFSGALLKQAGSRAMVLPFNTRVNVNHGLSPRDDVIITAEKICGLMGGGTAVGAPVQHLLRSRTEVDVVIGITDNEDWAFGHQWGHECEGSFLDLWCRYKSEVAPNAVAFLVTIAPYRNAVAPEGVEDVHFIYGWNASVLKYIGMVLAGSSGQVEAVRQMDL